MRRHPNCAAATAHQRVMHRDDQADPASDAGETWAESVLRETQSFDFESGVVCVQRGLAGWRDAVALAAGESRRSTPATCVLAPLPIPHSCSLYNGLHALAGYLPVVPGPCGLFRASATTANIITRVRARGRAEPRSQPS